MKLHSKLSRSLQTGAALFLLAASAASAMAADGATPDKKIAFSNSYAGNSFRQVMVESWEDGTAAAQKAGYIGGATVVSANNSATEQAGHIQNLILEGYTAIVINAASPTALNGVVKEACDAGILPTLPQIDAIVTQGGDGCGAAHRHSLQPVASGRSSSWATARMN